MSEELLRLKNVKKYLGIRGAPWHMSQAVKAVDGVNFVVRKGETVADTDYGPGVSDDTPSALDHLSKD